MIDMTSLFLKMNTDRYGYYDVDDEIALFYNEKDNEWELEVVNIWDNSWDELASIRFKEIDSLDTKKVNKLIKKGYKELGRRK